MAIPAYLWIKDDGGADIKGSVTVQGREGSVEVLEFDHSVYIPTDGNTGKLTGTRVHTPLSFVKGSMPPRPTCTRPSPAARTSRAWS
jgi:type VI secretion system secreted protein Hcp